MSRVSVVSDLSSTLLTVLISHVAGLGGLFVIVIVIVMHDPFVVHCRCVGLLYIYCSVIHIFKTLALLDTIPRSNVSNREI